MTILTAFQISQLHSNGVYTTLPDHPLFSLETIKEPANGADILRALQVVSKSPNTTVAASFFMRRYGMFTAMQLVQFIVYEEFWQGKPSELKFGTIQEFGNRTVSTFPCTREWQEVSIENAFEIVQQILSQIQSMAKALQSAAPISTNVLWENVFGFWLWQFHVLLNDPSTEENARIVLQLLKEDESWKEISKKSKFASYLNGREPSDLLNTTVRKTCCLSKDVPGLMQCGFCPLKS